MAIIKVFKAKDNINRLLKYISNPIKTQNGLLVSGKDCSANTCYEEMQSIKELYDKKDGYTAFHFVQSFSPKDNLSYEKAHEIGLQFAEYFKGYQVLFATHTDREHIHTHFVINSVSFEDGKKFHMSKKDLEKIKEFSNKLCEENGLSTIDLENKNKVKDISKNELAVAHKGQSWKFKLMNDIDYCMSISNTKEEYIKNMKSLNYQVVWTDTRKYITYTTPDGQRCRDKSLHDKKYLKENMEYGFKRNEKNESEFSRKDIHDTRSSNRNSDWYCDNTHYNPTIETLRHLAYLMGNSVYIGPKRNIRGCYSGDLSNQARREWAILHRNSDGFDWYEDDFEI